MKRTAVDSKDYALPFVIYTPEKLGGKLPLIIQLHGAGEVGNGGDDLCKVEVHGLANYFKTKDIDCITVMPQCPSDSFWIAEIPTVHELIMQVIASYPVDEKRIYLTGLSMGGYGTWNIACRYPSLFAAIAPICGEGISWYGGRLSDLPARVFHGDCDTVVSPHQSLAMVSAINLYGKKANASLTLFPGVDHNSWDPAYDDSLIEWFLEHRNNRPKTVIW